MKKERRPPILTRLPLEVRFRIYRDLLTISSPIKQAGELVQSKIYFKISSVEHVDLCVSLLSICQQVGALLDNSSPLTSFPESRGSSFVLVTLTELLSLIDNFKLTKEKKEADYVFFHSYT